MVQCSAYALEVLGSRPGIVIPRDSKLVHTTFLLSTEHRKSRHGNSRHVATRGGLFTSFSHHHAHIAM